MTLSILAVLMASFLLYLAVFATVLGGLGLFSPKRAGDFGVQFNGKMSYVSLLTLGLAGLLPASMLIGVDSSSLAFGTAGITVLGVVLWKTLGFGAGWFFEFLLLAKRPARAFWKVERRRTGVVRSRRTNRWVTRDDGEVENAMRVGGFWAVFCIVMDVMLIPNAIDLTGMSDGAGVASVIGGFLFLFVVFAGGAIQQPAFSDV